jgi:hypothetical protein
MEVLTAEQIVKVAEKKSDTVLGQIRIINRMFRKQDDSNKWPINSKFSVTERAIRKVREYERQAGAMSPLEYALALENEESAIVNNDKNW